MMLTLPSSRNCGVLWVSQINLELWRISLFLGSIFHYYGHLGIDGQHRIAIWSKLLVLLF